MGYYIFDRVRQPASVLLELPVPPSDAELESWMERGTAAQRQAARERLVERRAEGVLVRCLASNDPDAAQLAMDGLWECWLNEKGARARTEMEAGIAAMNAGDLNGAAAVFHGLTVEFPEWAEPINKQATVLYLQGSTAQSIALCRRVVNRKPDHFGAWNGMALCAIQIEDWDLALEAVCQSLRLQPRSGYNQRLLRLIKSRLPGA